jgi:hypothetical protein
MRSLQVSRARIHGFVEGRAVDSYFYGRLCEYTVDGLFLYRILRADQIPGSGSGGKTVLLNFHDRLRRQKRLVSNFKGHESTTVFFIDKDVDDLTRRMKRSAHIVYTPTYDIEAWVYREGDLADSVAAACSLDKQTVVQILGTGDAWRKTSMNKWKSWLHLCCLTQVLHIADVVNFGVASRVNPTSTGPADSTLVGRYERLIRSKWAGPAAKFQRTYDRLWRQINAAERQGQLDRYFKGKWLSVILEAEITQAYPVEAHRISNFRQQVVGNLAQSVHVSEGWAQPFVAHLKELLAAVNP